MDKPVIANTNGKLAWILFSVFTSAGLSTAAFYDCSWPKFSAFIGGLYFCEFINETIQWFKNA